MYSIIVINLNRIGRSEGSYTLLIFTKTLHFEAHKYKKTYVNFRRKLLYETSLPDKRAGACKIGLWKKSKSSSFPPKGKFVGSQLVSLKQSMSNLA